VAKPRDRSYAAEQFVPSELERHPKSGSHFNCGHVFPGLDHLEIATANVGTLGKLFLRQVRQISQAIDILAKFDAGRFSHLLRMQRSNGTESEAYFALKLTSGVSRSDKVSAIVLAVLRCGACSGRQNAVKVGFREKI